MTTKQIKLIKPNFDGKIGFEVECVYADNDRDGETDKVKEICLKNHWIKSFDGSIRTTPTYNVEAEIKFHYDLKELNKNLPKIKKLLSLIKSSQAFGCGLHMHLSFEEICNYYKLSCWKFVDYFQKEYIKYAKTEEERERKNNTFCKFYPNKELYIANTNEQLKTTQKNARYYAVNFNSFNIHQTIEFRIFVGTDKYSRFVDNINFLIKTINDFLSQEKEISFGIIKDTPLKSKGKIIRKYVGEISDMNEIKLMESMQGEIQ